MEMRSAIVVGATGLVGSTLVKQLCESDEYVAVTVIARRVLDYSHPKLVVRIKEFDALAESDMEFAHEIFCCLGTTIKKADSREVFEKIDVEYPVQIAAMAKNRGIQHMIVISAMGANEKSFAYYNRVKGKMEKELIDIDLPQLSIVRPSLLVGNRSELRVGEKIGAAVLAVFNPLLIGPLKRYRSIKAEQVALAMMVIALYHKNAKLAIYPSNELAQMALPELEEEPEMKREDLFNWNKLQSGNVLDEEVTFDKSKMKEYKAEQDTPKD
ncbi:NAD(P)H-binding protein [Metasolibacillus sp.]|uniref:NAD(P)H-binding protein n=1 Tax=Metasolibacillus sp. TaxID=2703680 RepID=UPI0025EECB9F|nr:NAD(P)H-binding protein [Metasolibacillus sp.]MCT6924736.1 NAD(P)H-binding protein [Metasolibacillus sp.]MCT6940911.1 NAD(P)H-binding protein [Metasolibacillus sp.]